MAILDLTSNFPHPYFLFSIILLYIKEAVSHTFCSLSASPSRVAATGADAALYYFEIVFLIQLVMYIYIQNSIKNFEKIYGQKKRLRGISLIHYFPS